MPVFDSNCLYIIQCLALVFLAAPCVLFAGGMLICGLLWCGLHITRAMHLRLLGLPRCGRCRYCKACAPLVRSDDAIISRAKQRSKRAMSEIARVERAARAEGKTYGCYVALHEPRKG